MTATHLNTFLSYTTFQFFFCFFFSSLDSCVDFSWHSFDEQEKCYIFYFGTEYSNDPAEIKLFGI